MNKKVLTVIGLLAVIACIGMYVVGNNSSHMSELKDFWWVPAPIALICFIAANSKKKA